MRRTSPRPLEPTWPESGLHEGSTSSAACRSSAAVRLQARSIREQKCSGDQRGVLAAGRPARADGLREGIPRTRRCSRSRSLRHAAVTEVKNLATRAGVKISRCPESAGELERRPASGRADSAEHAVGPSTLARHSFARRSQREREQCEGSSTGPAPYTINANDQLITARIPQAVVSSATARRFAADARRMVQRGERAAREWANLKPAII